VADAPTVPAQGGAEGLDDDDIGGNTISWAELRARLGQEASGTALGPRVQAVLCAQGHPNHPHAATCRSCAEPIADRTVVVVHRPPLGFLVLEDGSSIELDRPVIVGRQPVLRSPVTAKAQTPRLVPLPDPDKMLSRVHLELCLDDWRVSVVDRDSRNGSVVELPGQPAVKLRPGEPFVITAGTKLTLGDIMHLVYEVR
jgi:hypothetical protein